MNITRIAEWIIIAGMVQGLFLLALLIRKPKKLQADYALICWFLLTTIHLFYFLIAFHQWKLEWQFLYLTGSALPVAYAPLIFFYLDSLLNGKRSIKTILFILSPFILYWCFYLILHYFFDALRVEGFHMIFASNLPKWIYHIGFGIIGLNIFYAIGMVDLLLRHRKEMGRQFSFSDQLNLKWVYYWIITFICSAILITGALLLSDAGQISYLFAFTFTSLLIVIQIILVGNYGLRQSNAFINYEFWIKSSAIQKQSNIERSKYQKSGLQEAQAEQLLLLLKAVMDEEKPYLDSHLSIHQLAEQLSIPAYQLSQLINGHLQTNFYDFVNGYRVELVKQKLKDPAHQHYSILAIALDSGFHSKSSFNKVFKRFTALTPSQYKKAPPSIK